MDTGPMSRDPTLYRFRRLFGGLDDAYFTDSKGCVKEVVSTAVWYGHLFGGAPIGIYPLTRQGKVSWGCIDIDNGDLGLALEIAGRIPGALIENSKSKGFHVWAFFETPQVGAVVRSKLRGVCEASRHPDLEVNPKQDFLPPGGVGNCVRLPYGAAREPFRQEVQGCPTLEDFFEALDDTGWSDISGLPDSQLMLMEAASAKWTSGEPGEQQASKVFYGQENVYVGERDNSLWALACYMQGRGMSKAEALRKMEEIWTTQVESNETFPLETALRKVERVFGLKGEKDQRQR